MAFCSYPLDFVCYKSLNLGTHNHVYQGRQPQLNIKIEDKHVYLSDSHFSPSYSCIFSWARLSTWIPITSPWMTFTPLPDWVHQNCGPNHAIHCLSIPAGLSREAEFTEFSASPTRPAAMEHWNNNKSYVQYTYMPYCPLPPSFGYVQKPAANCTNIYIWMVCTV